MKSIRIQDFKTLLTFSIPLLKFHHRGYSICRSMSKSILWLFAHSFEGSFGVGLLVVVLEICQAWKKYQLPTKKFIMFMS